MIEKTVFTKKILCEEIKSHYGIDIKKIKHINRGSANIYIVTNKIKYVLKEYQSTYNKEKVEKDYITVNRLKDIYTYHYYLTNDDKPYFEYNNRICTLTNYISGKLLLNKMSKSNLIRVANLHGKITNLLKTYTDYEDKDNFVSFDTLQKNKQFMQNYICLNNTDKYGKLITADYKEKINIINIFEKKFDFEKIATLTKTNCHGDYSNQQLIFNKNIYVIDFAAASKIPVSWEIIRSYTYSDTKCRCGKINIQNLVDYIQEFNKEFKLTKNDVEFMIDIYFIQLLSSNYGYKQNIGSVNKNLLKFASFRTAILKDIAINYDFYKQKLSEISL